MWHKNYLIVAAKVSIHNFGDTKGSNRDHLVESGSFSDFSNIKRN